MNKHFPKDKPNTARSVGTVQLKTTAVPNRLGNTTTQQKPQQPTIQLKQTAVPNRLAAKPTTPTKSSAVQLKTTAVPNRLGNTSTQQKPQQSTVQLKQTAVPNRLAAKPTTPMKSSAVQLKTTAVPNRLAAKHTTPTKSSAVQLKTTAVSNRLAAKPLQAPSSSRTIQREKTDPALRSKMDPQTRNLALKQTTAARALLHNPSTAVRQELSIAAKKLMAIYEKLPSDQQQAALGARLLGKEGIMRGQRTADMYNALSRVASNHYATTSTDRAAVIELMGGIGALFADTGATTGMESRSKIQAEELRSHLRKHIPGITKENVDAMKKLGDSGVVGPNKKQERERPDTTLVPRQGMHNLGAIADEIAGIPDYNRLPRISWQKATIDTEKVKRTTEPLAGHMSGSPSEALMVWDLLRGEVERPYTNASTITLGKHESYKHFTQKHFTQKTAFHTTGDEAREKSARLATATAYLVATGFHSSVEVVETALKYTGQNPRFFGADKRSMFTGGKEDASDYFGHGAATDMIAELHTNHTHRGGDMPLPSHDVDISSKPKQTSSLGTMAREGIFPTTSKSSIPSRFDPMHHIDGKPRWK